MTCLKNSVAGLAVLLSTASLPVLAESSASSAASGSVSTSVGSLSTSLQTSSDGSSKGTEVADGDYRIIELAALADRPGTLRLTLQADGAAEPFFLYLPEQTVERSRLAQGGTVTARQRAYGVEFSHGEQQQAFFLVMADDWYRELQTNVVRL